MHFSIRVFMEQALLTAPLVGAFYTIVPSKPVRANVETEVTIKNDLDRGNSSYDARFTHFQLYLNFAPDPWAPDPVCLLANATPIATESLRVVFPAAAFPPGTLCQLSAVEWDATRSVANSRVILGDVFSIEGDMAGTWSRLEQAGKRLTFRDFLPCASLPCARACGDRFYPGNADPATDALWNDTQRCIAACPGVWFPPKVAQDLGLPPSAATGGTPTGTGGAPVATSSILSPPTANGTDGKETGKHSNGGRLTPAMLKLVGPLLSIICLI
jgi:hypothetical protein